MKLGSFLLNSLPMDMEYSVSQVYQRREKQSPGKEEIILSQESTTSLTETSSTEVFRFTENDRENVKVTSFLNGNRFYSILLPVALAAVVLLLIMCAIVQIVSRRRKLKETGSSGPSIVVYPSQRGTGPQFLTKEIRFSLPVLRQAASLGDLLTSAEAEGTSLQDTDSPMPANFAHSQRSNSFSCYGLGSIDPALYRDTLDFEEDLQFPEGHLGRLWFSLRYEAATEKLLVSLSKAKNLPSRSLGTINSCDPFVRIHLLPDERRYQQSKQKKKTCNPYFEETFVFQVPSKELADHTLKFTIIDSGRTKRRSVIGHILFPLCNVPADGEQNVYKLDVEKEVQEVRSNKGEMMVSLLYNENLHRLTVTINEARNLKFRDEKQDSYVRVTLKQHYRTIKVKRTSAVKGTDSPNFSQCFNFKIPSAQIDVTSINFCVYQSITSYGRDKLIGKFVLGSYMFARGKALNHWNSAFSNPMKQVQQWHALCE